MRKKYRDLKRKGNVIVFPTTINRLLTDGMTFLKNEKYEQARDKLYQVLAYEPDHTAALGAYSYCLYELGEFEEALDVCRELLRIGPIHYLETMELYISILMQVRQYEEAEQMIEALIEENVLPEERLEQFRQLRDLNEQIVANASIETVDSTMYQLEEFLSLSPLEQEWLIMDLPPASYNALKKHLLAIVGHPEVDLLTKTYILFTLHQENIDAVVEVEKFHYQGRFRISELPDPLSNPRLESIKKQIEESLSKDPSRLELAKELFDRHVYLFYPFHWPDFPEAEVAAAYMDYLDMLFSGETSAGANERLLELIIQAEQWFEMRNQ
ncbi:DUF3196 family protein [Planococcus salinus]|uniref:DUF3196 domain-containing protein n=1 Tax=Planococcus salinus TaxID=1848460 RepID=A0A3M8PB20_9BACL|nr:DUF3196 family protein [Planococcus salinus]RNF40909.1 DUF3196 domain-containing protein [Planococcus salinus]